MENEEQSRYPRYAVAIGERYRCVVDSYAKAQALCDGVKGARKTGCETQEEAEYAYSPAAHKRWQFRDSQDGLPPLQSPDNPPPVVLSAKARRQAAARRVSNNGSDTQSPSTQSTTASASTNGSPASPLQATSSLAMPSTQTQTPISSDDGFGSDDFPRSVKRARRDDDGDYHGNMKWFDDQSEAMFYLIQAFKNLQGVGIGTF